MSIGNCFERAEDLQRLDWLILIVIPQRLYFIISMDY